MGDLICFDLFCGKRAKYKCNCSFPETFWCSFHLQTHLVSSNNEHSIEAISKQFNLELNEDSYECPCRYLHKNHSRLLNEHSYQCPLNPLFEVINKNPNEAIQSTLILIYEQISAIEKVKNKFPKEKYFKGSYYSDLIKYGFQSVKQYTDILDAAKVCAEWAETVYDIPLSFMDIMDIAENIKICIEFLEKLNIAWLLEYQVQSYWLKKGKESPQKIDQIKSEINRKIQDTKNWCLQHKTNKSSIKIDNIKIDQLLDGLNLISELINNNSEAKYFFHIRDGNLIICGGEAWKWLKIGLPLNQFRLFPYEEQVIELPNWEIFCLGFKNSFIIDLSTLAIKKNFPATSSDGYSTPIYYKNCVYIFSESWWEKIDIINKKKSILYHPMKDYSCNFSCCIYRDLILVCPDKTRKIYQLDPVIESYSEIIVNVLTLNSIKMIFTANMRAYISEDKNWIYESEIDNEYAWNKLGYFEIHFIEKEIDLSHLNAVYFNFSYSEIYQFDLRNKNIFKRNSKTFGSIEIKNQICKDDNLIL